MCVDLILSLYKDHLLTISLPSIYKREGVLSYIWTVALKVHDVKLDTEKRKKNFLKV